MMDYGQGPTDATFEWRCRKSTKAIIIHDSHTPGDMASTTAFLRTRGRQMGLLEVGYHYIIERDARAVCTRHHSVVGSHIFGHNADTIGICVAGGFGGSDNFTDDQLWVLSALVSFLCSEYPGIQVLGHSEVPKSGGRFRQECDCPCFDMGIFRRDYMQIGTPPKVERQADPTKVSPQGKLLLDYMQAGRTLSTFIAISQLGIASLSSRIAELRAQGYHIKGEPKKDHFGKDYLSYSMEGPGDAAPVA